MRHVVLRQLVHVLGVLRMTRTDGFQRKGRKLREVHLHRDVIKLLVRVEIEGVFAEDVLLHVGNHLRWVLLGTWLEAAEAKAEFFAGATTACFAFCTTQQLAAVEEAEVGRHDGQHLVNDIFPVLPLG